MSNPFLNIPQVNAIIRIRRGPDVDRFQFVYDDGELIYSTDKKRLFIGDGVGGTGTYGGTLVANKVWMSDSFDKLPYIEKYDLVYRTDDCGFYVLTGEQYLLPSNYIPIGGKKLINDNVVLQQPYVLPFATATTHGGIIVSTGLRMDDGKLSLDINPTSLRSVNNRLEVVTDNLVNSIPYASYTTFGKVRIGQNNGIDIANGTLGLRIDPNTLSISENNELKVADNLIQPLPYASETAYGRIKINPNNAFSINNGNLGIKLDSNTLEVNANNELKVADSIATPLPYASESVYGKIKINPDNAFSINNGNLGLKLDANTLSVNASNELTVVGGAGGGSGGTLASYTTNGTIQITPNNGLNITGGNLSLGINPSTLSINGSNELQVNTSSILNSLSYASYTDYGKIKINSNSVFDIPNGVLSLKYDSTKFSINASNELTIIGGDGGSTAIDIVPIGTVSWFAASAAPTGYLECNGAIISQVIHSELYAVIGTKFNKGGEGVGNFRLPDLRGEFIRGWDHGRNVNTGRVFGSDEDYATAIPKNTSPRILNGDGTTSNNLINATHPSAIGFARVSKTGENVTATSVDNGQAGIQLDVLNIAIGDPETRPRNVALLPCIKAFGTATGSTSILNFIEKPATPSNGQTIIYNGSTSTWIASSVRQNIDLATTATAGIVKPTNGLNITSGELSVKVDNSTIKISPTSGLYVAAGAGTTNVFDTIPLGTINWYAVSAAPVGYLECNGDVVQQTVYPDLYAIIGTRYNTGGEATTNFRLPDLRGEFIRGWDNGRGVDTGRVFGSKQTGSHVTGDDGISANTVNAPGVVNQLNLDPPDGTARNILFVAATHTENHSLSSYWGQTRPRNVALLPCIKAVKTVTGTTAALNFIEKPLSATNGQTLTYNEFTNKWEGGSPILTVSEPALGLGFKGWGHYNGSYYTKNQFYFFGNNNISSPSNEYVNPPRRAVFLENYLLKNPSLTIKKTFDSLYYAIVLLSDGTLWASGNLTDIQNMYALPNAYSAVFLKLNSMFSNKAVEDFNFSSSSDALITLGILCTDGSAFAWGYNGHGQIGNGNTNASTSPVAISVPGKTIAQISVAGWSGTNGNILLRMTDGTLFACGYNAHGQLGVGDTTGRTSFTQCRENSSTFLTNVSAVCEVGKMQGGYTRYIIKNDGTLWAAGLNNYYQLGDGTTTQSNYYKQVNGLSNVRKVVTAGWSTVTTVAALDSSGFVYTWGRADYGAAGQGSAAAVTSPTRVTVYRDTPSSNKTLPIIKDIFGTDCSNVGAIGLISTSKQLFTAGYQIFPPISQLGASNLSTTTYYRFELAGLENVEEAVFYTNQLSEGGGASIGTIARDSGGIIWVWGYEAGFITPSNRQTHTPSRVNY